MSEDQSPGLIGRLRRVAASSLYLVECRINLFATELESDLTRLGKGMILLMLAALFGAFTLLTLLAFMTVLLWDNHRLLALGLSTLCFGGLAVWCATIAAQKLLSAKSFLENTRTEFEKDRSAFGRKP